MQVLPGVDDERLQLGGRRCHWSCIGDRDEAHDAPPWTRRSIGRSVTVGWSGETGAGLVGGELGRLASRDLERRLAPGRLELGSVWIGRPCEPGHGSGLAAGNLRQRPPRSSHVAEQSALERRAPAWVGCPAGSVPGTPFVAEGAVHSRRQPTDETLELFEPVGEILHL